MFLLLICNVCVADMVLRNLKVFSSRSIAHSANCELKGFGLASRVSGFQKEAHKAKSSARSAPGLQACLSMLAPPGQ